MRKKVQNEARPFCHGERLICSIRRECLDHVVVFGEADLRRALKAYASYYNRIRTHLSLGKDAPLYRRRQTVGKIVSIPILGGLHHQYVGFRYSARTAGGIA